MRCFIHKRLDSRNAHIKMKSKCKRRIPSASEWLIRRKMTIEISFVQLTFAITSRMHGTANETAHIRSETHESAQVHVFKLFRTRSHRINALSLRGLLSVEIQNALQ